jgi:hypothetical protein
MDSAQQRDQRREQKRKQHCEGDWDQYLARKVQAGHHDN